MLEHLKTERHRAEGAPDRLRIYMIGLLILGGIALWLATRSDETGPEELPNAEPDPVVVAAESPTIDLERLPQADTPLVHGHWQWEALQYLFSVVDLDFVDQARRLSLPDLGALPFEEARGSVFEAEGTVEDIEVEQFGDQKRRLWAVLVASDDGSRVIVLKRGLKSDSQQGHPQYSHWRSVEYVEEGDRVLVRGIYLQRRIGTIGTAILREAVPVLVATPPDAAFRKLPKPAAPIGDPLEADWDEIKDRFLGETQFWAEDALFEVVQWARSYGHDRIVEDIRSGKLEYKLWGTDVFERWGDEVKATDANAPRPFTESLRGRFFATRGLVGAFLREGWKMVPRNGSRWGVDTLYKIDLMSDHWGNRVIRTVTPWPAETYGAAAEKKKHVTLYGFFLKNHTYPTQQGSGGEHALLTMPMFIVLHVEEVQHLDSPYRTFIWIISGIILALFVVFYFVFVRGEKREAARMDSYRRELRKRRREAAVAKQGSTEEPPGDTDDVADGPEADPDVGGGDAAS